MRKSPNATPNNLYRKLLPKAGLAALAFVLAAAALCGQGRGPQAVGPAGPATSTAALTLTPARFSVRLRPGIDIGFNESQNEQIWAMGGSVLLGAEYVLPFLPFVFVSGDLGYDFHYTILGPPFVSVTSASVGTGIRLGLFPWLSWDWGVSGGYFYGFLNDFSASGGNPFFDIGMEIEILPGPLHVSLGYVYRKYVGLESGVRFMGGVSYDLDAGSPVTVKTPEKPAAKPQPLDAKPAVQPPAKPSAAVELKDASFDDIFPVFRTYYATHPLGRIVLHNGLDKPISGIKISFQIKEFMTDPTDCPAPAELGPGESKSVDLFGLFLPSILQTTERTKTQAKIDLEYTLKGQVQRVSMVQVIPILDRNATTWADDRRAAAFVTAKDPAVLTFSKNVNSVVKGKVKGAVNPNLLTAMAFFETLQLYGLTYSLDPVPTLTANKQVADYIQFPRQTLQYKGGKCSDFSVLYAALLESVGIETAFITIPGHIFAAFSTGLSPAEARDTFSRADDLIVRAGKSWIPVEVTESAGFLKAWQDGAKEWRENLSREQAAFYPLHDAWSLYEPVGLSGADAALELPSSEKIIGRYMEGVGKFVDQEIFPRVAALTREIEKAQDPRKPRNALGVLYAKYGQYERAAQEFQKLLAKEEYTPALLNLGNIFSQSGQKETALQYFNRAYAKDPGNPRVLLAVARVCHDLENYYEVRKVYAELKARDPDLALRFAYLDMKGEEATRAAEIGGVSEVVLWEE
jgi:tetratricopeptide (TPR) repeat protein